jgi:hypothetical protein
LAAGAGGGVFFAAGVAGGGVFFAAGAGGVSASADGATIAAPTQAHITVATALTRAHTLFDPKRREAPTKRHRWTARRRIAAEATDR